MKDPATINNGGETIPNVTIDNANALVRITGSNVTLDGYDFSGNGGWEIDYTGTQFAGSNITIKNSYFKTGSRGGQAIACVFAGPNMQILYCTFDGDGFNRQEPPGGPASQPTVLVSPGYNFVFNYNYCLNIVQDVLQLACDVVTSPGIQPCSAEVKFNFFNTNSFNWSTHTNIMQTSFAVDRIIFQYNTWSQPVASNNGYPAQGASLLRVGDALGYQTQNVECSFNTIVLKGATGHALNAYNDGLGGASTWVWDLEYVFPPAWIQNHAYTASFVTTCLNGGNSYVCITSGTSENTPGAGPTGTGSDIVDGTVHWAYIATNPQALNYRMCMNYVDYQGLKTQFTNPYGGVETAPQFFDTFDMNTAAGSNYLIQNTSPIGPVLGSAPASPVISSATVVGGNTIQLDGTGIISAEAIIMVATDGSLYGSTTVDGSGNWTFTTGALASGTYSFNCRQTVRQPAGTGDTFNTSQSSNIMSATI